MERLSWAALMEYVERRYEAPATLGHIGEVGMAYAVLGIGREKLYRWKRDGVTMFGADEAAGALGVHPSTIWPEWMSEPDLPPLCGTGSHGGVQRHRKAGEPLCLDCSEFINDYFRQWRANNPEAEARRVAKSNAVRPDKHRNAVRNQRSRNRVIG